MSEARECDICHKFYREYDSKEFNHVELQDRCAHKMDIVDATLETSKVLNGLNVIILELNSLTNAYEF